MKVAIVGSGISGLVSAYALRDAAALTIYEANDRLGGHTHTHDIKGPDGNHRIDSGFIVFNDWTYPNLIKLFNQVGVDNLETTMSFSVRADHADLEYNGTTLNTLFAQRRNLIRPEFLRMIAGIMKFNSAAKELAAGPATDMTLGEFLRQGDYPKSFENFYIKPMSAAIWSAGTGAILDIPAHFLARFFANHGFLNIDERPQWRVVKGGSSAYIPKIMAHVKADVRLKTPVKRVTRNHEGVTIEAGGKTDHYDHVIFACHSDQALRCLGDASQKEQEILGAIPFTNNHITMHTDPGLLPKRRLAWAAWNYLTLPQDKEKVMVTYNMNILQRLKTQEDYCVTLNDEGLVRKEAILKSFDYEHPVFDVKTTTAQARHGEISGQNRTHYCGAYWRNGFHEDGVWSALQAMRFFEKGL